MDRDGALGNYDATIAEFCKSTDTGYRVTGELAVAYWWFTMSAAPGPLDSVLGPRQEFLKPGKEEVENRRGVRLAVTHGEVDSWALRLPADG